MLTACFEKMKSVYYMYVQSDDFKCRIQRLSKLANQMSWVKQVLLCRKLKIFSLVKIMTFKPDGEKGEMYKVFLATLV